jgi:hypothetical protein
MTDFIAAGDYLTEDEVLDRWPMLRRPELRRARKAGQIDWYAFPKGACYTRAQVQAYIDRTYLRTVSCVARAAAEPPAPTNDSRSGDTTCDKSEPTTEEDGTPAVSNLDLGKCAADLLAQQILSRQRSPSPPSSPKPRRAKARPPLRAVGS